MIKISFWYDLNCVFIQSQGPKRERLLKILFTVPQGEFAFHTPARIPFPSLVSRPSRMHYVGRWVRVVSQSQSLSQDSFEPN